MFCKSRKLRNNSLVKETIKIRQKGHYGNKEVIFCGRKCKPCCKEICQTSYGFLSEVQSIFSTFLELL